MKKQFKNLVQLVFGFFSQYQRQEKLALIHRIYYRILQVPQLFTRFPKKIKTLFRLIATGRPKLVLGKINQILNGNLGIEEVYANPIDMSVDIVILSSKHTRYVGNLLQKALLEAKYNTVLYEQFNKALDVGQLYFVISPQMFPELPKNFVAFQPEQSVSNRFFTRKYLSNLKRAYRIFEYSATNIQFLLKNDISYQKIFYLPIGSFPEYEKYLADIGYQIDLKSEQIEVLFYGDPSCERRQIYLTKLKSIFNVTVVSEVFDEDLISLICSAKVVVNIHYDESALLETTRIYETLSLGIPIVSESSVDIDRHMDLNGVVSFTPIGDIDAVIQEIHLLLTDTSQRQRRLAIERFTRQDSKFFDYFKRFLLSNDLFSYSFDNYQNDVDIIDLSKQLDLPRLCLTLTETPTRKSAFLANPTYGFEIVEGIRYDLGWIGCGMSYKYILNTVKKLGGKCAIVCEDDVVFPEDFEAKLSNILSYLKYTKKQWHIYSGLIADLDADANILAIEEYEGIEYIYINKMTSMVMNIYSPEIIDIISQWDQNNKDLSTNTIDKYIESQADIILVTTLPFLVGHSEDKESTLWGFMNTHYTDLIEASQKRLAEKVIHYKENLGG